MQKNSTMRRNGSKIFKGRQLTIGLISEILVVLLCSGWIRESHSRRETSNEAGSDEADLCEDTAKSHRNGHRNAFPLGEPAFNSELGHELIVAHAQRGVASTY